MREEFLKLLIENPGDISIGLIYADWLEEQGDPEESYWRDLRIYARACTPIFYGHSHIYSNGDGDGFYNDLGEGNGAGFGFGTEDGDGEGDGCYMAGFDYGRANGDGLGGYEKDSPEVGNQTMGRCLRFEVLIQGRFVLVCDRGFVLIGDVSPHPSDWQRVIVDNCATVRLWGTNRGLGQLALEGPQTTTILDYEGNGVDVLRATILRAIPCNEAAWEKYPEIVTKKAD